jgi:hypothetical protein
VRAGWTAVRSELQFEADLVKEISAQLACFRVRLYLLGCVRQFVFIFQMGVHFFKYICGGHYICAFQEPPGTGASSSLAAAPIAPSSAVPLHSSAAIPPRDPDVWPPPTPDPSHPPPHRQQAASRVVTKPRVAAAASSSSSSSSVEPAPSPAPVPAPAASDLPAWARGGSQSQQQPASSMAAARRNGPTGVSAAAREPLNSGGNSGSGSAAAVRAAGPSLPVAGASPAVQPVVRAAPVTCTRFELMVSIPSIHASTIRPFLYHSFLPSTHSFYWSRICVLIVCRTLSAHAGACRPAVGRRRRLV